MAVALSDMSRDALVRELRVALASGDLLYAKVIKYHLAKKPKARNAADLEFRKAAPIRGYIDD